MNPDLQAAPDGPEQPLGGFVSMASTDIWFACHYPERPTDPLVRWHYRHCTPCWIKAQALAYQHPDDPHIAWLVGVTEPVG